MSHTKSKLKLLMGYGCKSARRSTTCVVIWCCINLAPRCGGLFRCTCGRMCLRREGAVCGSGMGAPIIALLLRRFCGEVGAPTAHVGARRGAVRGDNEAFQPSSSEALGQFATQPPLSALNDRTFSCVTPLNMSGMHPNTPGPMPLTPRAAHTRVHSRDVNVCRTHKKRVR